MKTSFTDIKRLSFKLLIKRIFVLCIRFMNGSKSLDIYECNKNYHRTFPFDDSSVELYYSNVLSLLSREMSFVEKFENKFIIYLLIWCHKRYSLDYFTSVVERVRCVYRLNYRGLSPARSFVFIRGLVCFKFSSSTKLRFIDSLRTNTNTARRGQVKHLWWNYKKSFLSIKLHLKRMRR